MNEEIQEINCSSENGKTSEIKYNSPSEEIQDIKYISVNEEIQEIKYNSVNEEIQKIKYNSVNEEIQEIYYYSVLAIYPTLSFPQLSFFFLFKNCMANLLKFSTSLSVPFWSNFFNFHVIFGKNLPNNRLAL